MGLLTVIGLIGSVAYTTYFAKNETQAFIGDAIIKPTNNPEKDKKIIQNNFELICKRCNVKLDKNKNPIFKKGYNPCVAYLQYRGFQESISYYFKELYIQKYNKSNEDELKSIQYKHNNLFFSYYDTPANQKETKIFRYWDYGDTESKCKKLMKNKLWSTLVSHYNIVKDGSQNVEIWTISAPSSILKQIDTIYNEVCFLEAKGGN